MKFLFTCGGTAGHINPALAVAGAIKEAMPDSEFLFVGAEGRMETDLVPRAGYEIRTVRITNIHRGFSAEDIKHNLNTLKNVVTSTGQAKQIIREFQPDAAVGTGGYVCYPVLKAAHAMGVPTAVHESNAVPGLTTKMLEGVVDTVMVGFEESRANYKHPERVVVTGTPVRGEFMHADKLAARRELGLPEDKPLVASVWGSLGAGHMNEIMTDFIIRACANPFFGVVHSTGKAWYQKMTSTLEREKPGYDKLGMDVREYIYDMPLVMAAADLVMCRAGASTLAELTAMGKPAVLIPSPNVTNNHQEKNARVLADAGAAKLLLEPDFTADSLLGLVSELLHHPEQLDVMSEKMRALGVPDATGRIAGIVLDLAGRHAAK
ncbi:MAG TPA: UDP-N-acetylglucosamine--N-acetylmuramyl-(pentapeptide) pyrophosphoryl-undecaprenol N-acetylglucosamine transferase [Candidatus Scatomorpha merdigallinarum]|nr:UDP-N-acetylglucosamine--N-acetylmuramyl-(pentapeptide) pyrophosphoryl-undecaprenol N-acetylglucosamine transferase [Candidatus Scatomorpha merdigallinarum]